MTAAALTTPVNKCIPITPDISRLIVLERRLLEAVNGFLESGAVTRYIDAQYLHTRKLFPESFDRGGLREGNITESHLRSTALVFGLDEHDLLYPDTNIAKALIALSPALRARVVFRDDERRPPLIRDIRDVPALLTAILVLAELAHRAGMRSITYQTLSGLMLDERPLLALIAHINHRAVWRRAATVTIAVPPRLKHFQDCYLKIVAALIRNDTQHGRTMGDIIRQHIDAAGMERIHLIRYLSTRLIGSISVDRGDRDSADLKTRVVAGVQRSCLRTLNDAALGTLANILARLEPSPNHLQ